MTLTTVRLADIKTQTDLIEHALTAEQAAEIKERYYHPPEHTKGVGKNKGRTYVTAKVLALNEKGEERYYKLCISDLGNCTVRFNMASKRQHDADEQAKWEQFPTVIQNAVRSAFPGIKSQYCQNVIATAAMGKSPKYNGLSTILGRYTNIRSYTTLFPEDRELIDTVGITNDRITAKLAAWGKALLKGDPP